MRTEGPQLREAADRVAGIAAARETAVAPASVSPEGSGLRERVDGMRSTAATTLETAVAATSVGAEGAGLGDAVDRVVCACALARERAIAPPSVRSERTGLGESHIRRW